MPVETVVSSYLEQSSPSIELDNLSRKMKEEITVEKKVKTWKRASSSPNMSKLMIGDNDDLALKAVQAKVTIDGFRARVVLEHYFYNEHNKVLEGTFKLRLPNGATPYFFAFGETIVNEKKKDKLVFFDKNEMQAMGDKPDEIMKSREKTWIEPKEARMVPRVKAAHAYRQTVQHRVDPALMEWSGSGIFSARVFPLAAKKIHRIIVAYDVDLLALGDDLEYQLDIPSTVSQRVIDINITQPAGSKIILSPLGQLANSKDNRSTDSNQYVFNTSQDNLTYHQRFQEDSISGIKAKITKSGPILLAGQDEKTGAYFATRFPVKLNVNNKQTGAEKGVFLVDVSLSSNPDKFNIWLQLLQSILENNRDSIKQFAVSFFNIEQFWWQEKFLANTPENIAVLMAYANQLALEGATDLNAALQEGVKPDWFDGQQDQYDVFLLSDGGITWGEENLNRISKTLKSGQAKAIFAYNNGIAGTDLRVLQHITRESGGAIFSVLGDAEVKKAAIAHRSRSWQIKNIQVDGIENNSDLLLAGRPINVFPGQILQLAGRGQVKGDARVIVTLQQNEQQQILEIPLSKPLNSILSSRIYGQIAVGQLESFYSATEEMSKAYATHFRITGQTCSLLMLESEEDYLNFNIKPEEDAFVVMKKMVADKVAQILADMDETLGDPKKEFLDWVDKLETTSGLDFKAPGAFKLALSAMPEESFLVKINPLQTKLRTWQGMPLKVKDSLKNNQADYDLLMEEARRRLTEYDSSDALKVVSSLLENNPGDTVLARDIAFSAIEWGLKGHAYHLFHRVAQSRPYEPQTYLAMAQILESMEQFDLALAYYEIGLIGKWDQRFGEFTKINAINYLRFLRRISNGSYQSSVADYARIRLDSVARQYDPGELDILVAMTWNTDGTDVDMHIIEPTGEECYYKNKKTKIGGHMTQDVTSGYGPEMYNLKNALSGQYVIKAKYFASDRNRTSVRTKVSAMVVKNWGRENEQVFNKTIILREGKSMHEIMTIKM